MAFNRKTITKELDMANLQAHNDNYNAIKTELDAHDTHVAAQTAHGSTSAATAGKIVQRDSAGRAKVSAPVAADDIARKAEVDAVQTGLDTHEADADVHLSAADRTKLDGIEDGAEPNQNAFAQVNDVMAASESDALTIEGGTGITITTNPTTRKVVVTATGDSTPGAHGPSHNNDGADPIPDLIALRDEFDALTPADIGAETPAGAQAKVDALAGEGNTKTVVEVVNEVADVTAQLADTAKKGNRYMAYILYRMFMGESVTLVCYGDSITYGYQVGGSGTQVANPYPAVLQSRLRQVYKNDNITVINAGHSGWRSNQALDNIGDVIALNPDLVLVMFGINDSNTGDVLLEPYRDNLTAITNAIRAAGSDLILLTPTPIRSSDIDSNKRLRLYADMVREVATNNGVCCVDLQYEITRLWNTAGLYPVDTLGDTVHFADDQYKIIADVVMYQVMQFNSPTNTVYVDSREEFSVPLVYSPFVDTNLTTVFTIPAQIYKQNYVMASGTSLYLRFDFFCAAPGMSLILRHVSNLSGGIMTVSDNGVDVAQVSYYSPGSHRINSESVLIEHIDIGWHSIIFDKSKLVAGPENGTNAYLTDVLFRPITQIADRSFINAATSVFPKVENFKSISSHVRASGNTASQVKGSALFNAGSVKLKSSKKLVIEAEGKWTLGTGITWFGDEFQNPEGTIVSGYQSGYLLYFSGGVTLFYTGIGNGTNTLHNEPFTIDYNLPHLLRIEHSSAGEIVVYVDGVQRISYTDTKLSSGYFGLWLNGVASMDLDRYEYCYIDV